jgi:SAM-dependent methyltransferase
MDRGIASLVKGVLSNPFYRWFRVMPSGLEPTPGVGLVEFGDLRRSTPISRVFGFDRGTPVDRYYIENFLARHASDIKGVVLEVGDDTYTRRFGCNRVTGSDVLHVSKENSRATIVADLADGRNIPSNFFDCIILTQTLQLVYDVRAALLTLHRILKPGGVLLATIPGISQLDDEWNDSWYWSFTLPSARRLFQEAFSKSLRIETYGNVLAATAFLQGIAFEELRPDELDRNDPHYQLVITVRATKETA